MKKDLKIYVAGHRGMVGSAIVRRLKADGYQQIITRTHAELDLTRQMEVEAFLQTEKPDYLFIAAAKVGGFPSYNSLFFVQRNPVIQFADGVIYKYLTKKFYNANEFA